MYGRRTRGRRRGGSDYALMMLVWQVARIGIENIPPVTLSLAVVMTAIHFGFVVLPPLHYVCIAFTPVVMGGEWMRVLLSPFVHVTDHHFAVNMASLLWKGKSLEPRMGSYSFAWLVAFFVLASEALFLLLSIVVPAGCAVGFSGVLFALKMVLYDEMDPNASGIIMGFLPVQMKWMVWAELLYMHLINPNASFVGHLSGILAGWLAKEYFKRQRAQHRGE